MADVCQIIIGFCDSPFCMNVSFMFLPRPTHVVLARCCYRKSSVRLSVCLSVRLSVTLRYREHIGWTSSKLITRVSSLGSSLPGAAIRAFDWSPDQRPRMILKGHYVLCFKTHACFGDHHENLHEDRPMSATKM